MKDNHLKRKNFVQMTLVQMHSLGEKKINSLVDQQVLVVALVGLPQQSVEEEESEMATGPKLLQLEAPLLTPKHSAPKPGPGIEFQAALVKTA